MSMFSVFAKKAKPSELVKGLKDNFVKLEKSTQKKDIEKVSEEICRQIHSIRVMMLGEPDNNTAANPEIVLQVVTEIIKEDVWPVLLKNLAKLEDSFETKKILRELFGSMIKKQHANKHPFVEYMANNSKLIELLSTTYGQVDIEGGVDSTTAIIVGAMLREACRVEPITSRILESRVWKFFEYVESSSFDVASDAFASFKEILTRHKRIVSEFIFTNNQQFFQHYTKLLQSPNYVTRRQSLKLLGELLLDKSNFKVMTLYISDPENLKLIMNLLRDKKKTLQFESFHVFKVFVANPDKPPAIEKILIRNKEKLILFLNHFQTDKDEEQFKEEKKFLLKQVQELPNWSG